jgi:hypothetical protein
MLFGKSSFVPLRKGCCIIVIGHRSSTFVVISEYENMLCCGGISMLFLMFLELTATCGVVVEKMLSVLDKLLFLCETTFLLVLSETTFRTRSMPHPGHPPQSLFLKSTGLACAGMSILLVPTESRKIITPNVFISMKTEKCFF